MRKYCVFLFTLSLVSLLAQGQHNPYQDSLQLFRNKYINEHDVVRGEDRAFLRFFPPDKRYCVPARFNKIYDAPWFKMETSGKEKKVFRAYGILFFTIHDTALTLTVYQSEKLMQVKELADYLFIPFTDKTSGQETYDNGRYIDLRTGELETGIFLLDFNKAYNPSCAYISGVYNCPIPPKENDLKVAIGAGEMKYAKSH